MFKHVASTLHRAHKCPTEKPVWASVMYWINKIIKMDVID